MPVDLPVRKKQSRTLRPAVSTILCIVIAALAILTLAMLPSSAGTGPLLPPEDMEGP